MVMDLKIGTYYKKENIFLGTLNTVNQEEVNKLSSRLKEKNIDDNIIERFIGSVILSFQEFDIFYKDEFGYTRFFEDGNDTIIGDNSDGKGIIENIIPVWEYYKEDELFEAQVNDSYVAIVATTIDPLKQYNIDYNIDNANKLQR